MKLLTVKDATEQYQDLLDEAQSIQAVAEADGDQLSDEQQARWDELMRDDNGEIAVARKRLDDATKLQEQRQKLALERRQITQPAVAGGEIDPPKNAAQPKLVSYYGELKCFKGPDARRNAYLSGQWLLAMLTRNAGGRNEEAEANLAAAGWGLRAAATTTPDSAGGYLVPEELTAAFWEARSATGVARALSDIRPMASLTLDVPKLASGPTVVYPGEATAITPSDQIWDNVRLTAVKRAVLSKISNELQADAIINTVDQWVSRTGHEIARNEDNEWINGDGTGTFGGVTGLLNALLAGGTLDGSGATWGDLTLADHIALMGTLPDRFISGPLSWVTSTNYYHGVMLNALAAGGGNTIEALQSGERGRPTFMGHPVDGRIASERALRQL